jgi:poly-beta-1,6-N-acetyl-D-glucosamine synthase
MKVIVLVPAHNEAAEIEETLTALADQARRPDAVVVVADNCADGTEEVVARFAGKSPLEISVLPTVGNTDKKAGALNQALTAILPALEPGDFVLTQDADSTLSTEWIETALKVMADQSVGAVGGIFYGNGQNGFIEQLQRNEYVRYARDILRRKRGVWVLTGTSTLFRVSVLTEIADARGSLLPGQRGQVYDLGALTEDMEITLACLTLGYRCVSPGACATTTELMPTWRDLWRQRLRWQRGALDNLRSHGVNRTTIPYLLQQLWAMVGFLVIVGYPALLAVSLAAGMSLTWQPLWIGIGVLSLAERVVTVRKAGWRGVMLTLTLAPEMIYDLFRFGVYLAGWRDTLFRRVAQWHHLGKTNSTPEGGEISNVR